MGLFYRSYELNRESVDDDKRSVDVSFSSETPVERYYGAEYLLHGKENVDLKQLKTIGAALLNHDPSIIVGPITNVRIEDNVGRATVTFDDDEDGNKALNKVRSGSLRGISVGYKVEKFREVYEKEEYELADGRKIKGPSMVALRWMPYEISFTPIPADSTVGVGRDMSRSLDGIEIERSNFNLIDSEVDGMDEKEVKILMESALKDFGEKMQDSIVASVRAVIIEDAKPKMQIAIDVYQDLLGRAGAVSIECKAEVADMAVEGKLESDIIRHILDKATNFDGEKTDKKSDDSTKTKDKAPKTDGARIETFEGMEDESFFDGLKNPSAFSM